MKPHLEDIHTIDIRNLEHGNLLIPLKSCCPSEGDTCWVSLEVSRLCRSEFLTFVPVMDKVDAVSVGGTFNCKTLTLGLYCGVTSGLRGVLMDRDGDEDEPDFLYR